MSIMIPNRGKGKEICDYLRKELSIPEGVVSFEVRFGKDEAVMVKCEYMWSRKPRADRGYGPSWDKLRLTILERDKYLCQACLLKGKVKQATDVDHKTPKAKGGDDDPKRDARNKQQRELMAKRRAK